MVLVSLRFPFFPGVCLHSFSTKEEKDNGVGDAAVSLPPWGLSGFPTAAFPGAALVLCAVAFGCSALRFLVRICAAFSLLCFGFYVALVRSFSSLFICYFVHLYFIISYTNIFLKKSIFFNIFLDIRLFILYTIYRIKLTGKVARKIIIERIIQWSKN
jgi:hypothetical protein